MPEVFYVPAPHDPWEWSWDAWVAIGTIALAVVTVLTLLYSMRTENRRAAERNKIRLKEAGYLSIVFDHEFHMVEGFSRATLRNIRKTWMRDTAGALEEIIQVAEHFHVPLLTKFAGRANRFDVNTATLVTVAMSRITQASRHTPDGDADLPLPVVRRMCRGAAKQLTIIIREVRAARASLQKYHPEDIKIVKPSSGRYRPLVVVPQKTRWWKKFRKPIASAST
jgi:hypothetical protein